MTVPLKQENRPKPLRIVKASELPPQRNSTEHVKVELGKIRRELLTLAVRIEKVSQSQETA